MTNFAARVMGFLGCVLVFSAEAVDVPKLKPGLWEMRMSSSAGGANPLLPPTVCVGAMPDAQRALEEENIKARCSKYEAKVVGGDLVVDAVAEQPRGGRNAARIDHRHEIPDLSESHDVEYCIAGSYGRYDAVILRRRDRAALLASKPERPARTSHLWSAAT